MDNELQTANGKPQTKILVTGAKGQLGKKIIEILGQDNELILTDSDNMDITDLEAVEKTFLEEKPQFVIHAAAYTKVDAAEDTPEICKKVNSFGTKNMALVSKKYDATLIYISTDYVFDGKKTSPYTEEDETNPLSVYGETKLQGEEFIEDICDKYYIMRIAWLFGELPEGHPGTNFVETMIRLAKEKDELNIVDDQIGSPTYTEDLVKAISIIVSSQLSVPYGVYHFSGNGACSWYDFAKEIFQQTNTNIKLNPITSDQFPQKAKRPMYSYMDKNKIEKALAAKVRTWQEMLKDYLSKRSTQ